MTPRSAGSAPPPGSGAPPGQQPAPPGGQTSPPGGQTSPPGGQTGPPGGQTSPPTSPGAASPTITGMNPPASGGEDTAGAGAFPPSAPDQRQTDGEAVAVIPPDQDGASPDGASPQSAAPALPDGAGAVGGLTVVGSGVAPTPTISFTPTAPSTEQFPILPWLLLAVVAAVLTGAGVWRLTQSGPG